MLEDTCKFLKRKKLTKKRNPAQKERKERNLSQKKQKQKTLKQ